MEDEREAFLSKNKESSSFFGYSVREGALELKSFRSFLSWVCLDQSNMWRAGLSWSIFFLLTIGVPLVSHFIFGCSTCDSRHRKPYDAIVQLSLSLLATLSFISLSSFAHKYGLKKFLFLDKLTDVSDKVRQGYIEQLRRSVKLLSAFVLPCFVADASYKIWWFTSGGTQIPYIGYIYVSDTIACTLQLLSWLYRTSIFFLVCVLFRMICYLQILELEDFAQVFKKESDVGLILMEHLKIRRNLRIISHRFRVFILWTLILVTASQLVSLLVTTESSGEQITLYISGEIALCSVTFVTGLFIILRSATKITHKAQAITSLAAKWHVCATINSFEPLDGETPTTQITSSPPRCPVIDTWESDNEEGDGDDDIDNTRMVPIFANTISYQKRQALVTYFENNKAGITVFGFMLDRTWLHTIFAIQLSLTLWLLNKTIGIS